MNPGRSPSPAMRIANLAAALAQLFMPLLHPVFGLGQSVGDMSRATPMPVVPAPYTFAIWGPIFVLALAYALRINGWLGGSLPPVYRRIGWLTAITFASGAVWMFVAQLYGNGLALVLLIGVMWYAATRALLVASRHPSIPTVYERHLLMPLLGLCSGWLTVAMFLNIGSAGLAASGGAGQPSSVGVGLITLGAAAVLGISILSASRRNKWAGGALVWAMAGVMVANANPSGSAAIGFGALLYAVLVLILLSYRPARLPG